MLKLPCVYEVGGVSGLGRLLGSPIGDADISTLFASVDAQHPVPPGHSGIDLVNVAPDGSTWGATFGQFIRVLLPGTLYAKGFDVGGVGHWAVTRHEQPGSPAVHLMHAHMTEPSPVSWGAAVQVGDVLGRVGLSGYTTGPHLHWGAAPGDINPYVQTGPGKVLWNPLDMLVQSAMTRAKLITAIGGGAFYIEEASDIAGARVVKVLVPVDDNPGPSSVGP